MDGTFKALLKTFLLSENAAEKIKLILNGKSRLHIKSFEIITTLITTVSDYHKQHYTIPKIS
jgi:hypothetical protein